MSPGLRSPFLHSGGSMTDDILSHKKMHFVWLGPPMPAHLQANIHEWKRLHHDWVTYVWSESNLPVLRNSDLYQRAADLVPRDALYQFRADLIRYELLYDFGGFYVDVDTRPLKSINDELAGHDVFAAMEDRTWVGNTYLGSVPGHPLFADIITSIPGNVKRNAGKRPNVLTGPKFLTPLWKRNGGYTAKSEHWFPYLYREVINGTVPDSFGDDVVAVHQWFHTATVMENRRRAHSR